MRNLEDELRRAFRREEPSSDFTDRVMERIAAPAHVKTVWWRRFFQAFEAPRIRWAAIGAAALLLIAIGVIGYQRSRRAEDQQASVQQPSPAPEQPEQANTPPRIKTPEKTVPPDKETQPRTANHRPRARVNQDRLIASREERREGLEAKRKLLLALQVTSFTLNEAQRIVREDRSGREE